MISNHEGIKKMLRIHLTEQQMYILCVLYMGCFAREGCRTSRTRLEMLIKFNGYSMPSPTTHEITGVVECVCTCTASCLLVG